MQIAVWLRSEFLGSIYRIEPLRARFRQRKRRTGEGARGTGSNVVSALFSLLVPSECKSRFGYEVNFWGRSIV
jgi:hypothetical protein